MPTSLSAISARTTPTTPLAPAPISAALKPTGDSSPRPQSLSVSETVYVLQSVYRMSKPAIAAALLPLIALPNLKIPHKARLRKTLDWYVRYNVSFVDAALAVLAQEHKLPAVVSFYELDRISRHATDRAVTSLSASVALRLCSSTGLTDGQASQAKVPTARPR